MGWRDARRLRSVTGWVCAVLAGLCIPVAVTAHWAHRTLLENGRYVTTLAPLAQDRQFTDRLAAEVTTVLYRDLPADVRSQSVARSARQVVQSAIAHQLAQPSFQGIWNRANSHAQKGAVQVLAGSEADRTGAVAVDLTPVVTTLLDNIQNPVVRPLIPVVNRLVAEHSLDVTLLTSAQLVEARQVFAQIIDAQWLFGGLALGLAVVALVVARRRWSTLLVGAACTAVATGAAFVVLAIARTVSVSRASHDGANSLLSGKVFDILFRFLTQDLTITLVVAVVVALAVPVGAFIRRRRRPSDHPPPVAGSM